MNMQSAWNLGKVSAVLCSPQLDGAENFVLDSRRRMGTNLGMVHASCCVSSLQRLLAVVNDCDPTTFQCRCAQERFAHAHHVKCDLNQNSSAAVRRHVSVHNFLSTVSQRLICSLPLPQRLKNSQSGIGVRTKVGKNVRNIQNRSSFRALRPDRKSRTHERRSRPSSSQSIDVSGCLPLRRSTIRHRHVQFLRTRSLETNSTVAKMCLVTTSLPLVCSRRFHGCL